MSVHLRETDKNQLLTRMEMQYFQAIRNNEPFSVIKQYYAEYKQLKASLLLQEKQGNHSIHALPAIL
ncbi:hypothetical protein SAMN05421788_112130 [Filimonas lacunae]|uniref:Uncharacterized protein n=1 Tax=Filimonas lacunae TaxID=477680 RepID=A0A173MLN9_9BACT|nr:hypothetical protein [Filimonas lacunae]BAV08321.1 hypothetical protein FLA_4357 [Filimonas lacunae]SIT33357.1 hypothetical protein SAMN05421788_112130 [Filimonas lacunae]